MHTIVIIQTLSKEYNYFAATSLASLMQGSMKDIAWGGHGRAEEEKEEEGEEVNVEVGYKDCRIFNSTTAMRLKQREPGTKSIFNQFSEILQKKRIRTAVGCRHMALKERLLFSSVIKAFAHQWANLWPQLGKRKFGSERYRTRVK